MHGTILEQDIPKTTTEDPTSLYNKNRLHCNQDCLPCQTDTNI